VHPDRRTWVLPAVLAALCLSLPVQLVYADRVAEPYPGLFAPGFHGISQGKGHVVKLTRLELSVDGRRIDPDDILPGDPAGRDELLAHLPRDGDQASVDAGTRNALRSAVVRATGNEPREVTITWQRHLYDLDSGKYKRGRTLAHYQVDLREDVS
jgi:hypothetical protein